MMVEGGGSLVNDLKALLERCNAYFSSSKMEMIIEQLEFFFLSLPLPDKKTDSLIPFYSKINDEDSMKYFYMRINSFL